MSHTNEVFTEILENLNRGQRNQLFINVQTVAYFPGNEIGNGGNNNEFWFKKYKILKTI
jgi:hypothetical protein